MVEISAEALAQLQEAEAALTDPLEVEGPPAPLEATGFATQAVGAAGSGPAKYLLLDHSFTSGYCRLWAHAGGAWRWRNVPGSDEAGIAQVAYASSRVDAWWDDSNNLSMIRCWKVF